MSNTRFVLAALMSTLCVVGCGDVCDDAADLCQIELEGAVQCEGEKLCRSECIVDADSCACDLNNQDDPLCTCLEGCKSGS